jgi:hypothetical protein
MARQEGFVRKLRHSLFEAIAWSDRNKTQTFFNLDSRQKQRFELAMSQIQMNCFTTYITLLSIITSANVHNISQLNFENDNREGRTIWRTVHSSGSQTGWRAAQLCVKIKMAQIKIMGMRCFNYRKENYQLFMKLFSNTVNNENVAWHA